MTFPTPPRGLRALPWKIPIYLYRAGLGWLLGRRFLLLRHTGRVSGQVRFAVLEIIHSEPDLGTFFVVSGFGKGSDWYQNILKQDQVEIQVGRRHSSAQASQLDPEAAGKTLLAYYEHNPASLKALSSIMGYQIEFTPRGILEFGRQIPVIQFSVQKEAHS